jgi:hypothetical protein
VQCGDGTTAATIPAQASGKRGVSFDGGDYIDTTLIDRFEHNTAFSFFTLVNLKSPSTVEKNVISAHDGSQTKGWKLDYGHATSIIRFVFQSGANLLLVSVPLVKQQMITLATTYDGSGLAAGTQIYINGVPQTKTVVSDTLGANSIKTGRSAILGASWNAAAVNAFFLSADTEMRHTALFPFALTATHVDRLHKRVMKRINLP